MMKGQTGYSLSSDVRMLAVVAELHKSGLMVFDIWYLREMLYTVYGNSLVMDSSEVVLLTTLLSCCEQTSRSS